MVAVTPVARKFVCGTTNCSFGRAALAAAASAGSPVTKPHFSYFPIFHVCSTSKQRTPLPSSLCSALFVLGCFFSSLHSVRPLFYVFPMKCDKKISIDIFLKGEEKAWTTEKVLLSDSDDGFFLKNWVWHRKITPLKPFFASLHLLPAIQTYTQSGLRKLRRWDGDGKRATERGNYCERRSLLSACKCRDKIRS